MKKLALHWKILLGMGFGVLAGILASQLGGKQLILDWVKPWGTIFINFLKMVAIPLIIASLIKGVADLQDMSKLSKIGGRTMGIYVFTTAMAVSVGLLLVNLVNPGKSISPETQAALLQQFAGEADKRVAAAASVENQPPLQFLIDLVPANIVQAMTDNGQMLQVITFAILFGAALIAIPSDKAKPVKDFFDGLNEVVLKMIDFIMGIAPLGVFALLAAMVVESPSTDVFVGLFWYALTVVAGLAIVLGIDALLVWLFTGRSPKFFFGRIAPAQLVAFSSSSSAATLPVTMECTENLGVDKEVASFVIPVGATVNMDGTALYQGVATVFIAQALGNDLSLAQQLSIVLTATLASIGSAAVPGAGMLMLVVILESVGVSPAGIALIFAIDRPLDMCRTVVNVTGDMSVSMVVANSLGKLHPAPEPKS